MAVAMASIGGNFGLFKATEKLPSSRAAPFLCSFGLDPFQLSCINPRRGLQSSMSAIITKASPTAMEDGSSQETDVEPTPIVVIDQDSDPDATIVEITFGDCLGALLDTMNALKNLGLHVVKANVYLDSSVKHNRLAITKASSGRKVDEPELLEAIRLTIINNLLAYHPRPESAGFDSSLLEKPGSNGKGENTQAISSNEILTRLKRYGISGVLSYGLLNTAYYLTTFLVVWFYVAPASGRMGYLAAVKRFLKVMAMVWVGSQVTKLMRAGGALTLAPSVDRGLSWFTLKFGFESQGKAFLAIAGFCFGLAFLMFIIVTLLWA